MKLTVLVLLTVAALVGVAVGFPANFKTVITYTNTNCTGFVQSVIATAGVACTTTGCSTGQYTTCTPSEVETRVGNLTGVSAVTFGTCGENATVAEISFEPDVCIPSTNSATLMTCNATHMFLYYWNGTTTCTDVTTPTTTPFAQCISASQNVTAFCGNMYFTSGNSNPSPSPSPVTPPTPPPTPQPPTPQPPPVFARPSAVCWANQVVNGTTSQVAFFDVQITKAGSYPDSSYFDGTTQHTAETDFGTTGMMRRFLHFEVNPTGASVSWTLNGTTATLNTSVAGFACPNTSIVVLLTFTGTAPDETAISNLVDVVANITGLPKDHIQVEIIVSAKRASFTAKVTLTGDATINPQVASAALVDGFKADPAPFETATGATASTATYQPPPPPPPSPTPPPSGNPTPPPPPTGPNSGAVVVGSLMAVTLLALMAL